MSRARMALWALLYAALFFYASTVVSPLGFAPKPLSVEQAIAIFSHVHYVQLGSDQQADWMANLLALVPLGFMTGVALTPRWAVVERVAGGLVALGLCEGYILAVKFVQVFFPRTVDLNYIIAQTIGAMVGVSIAVLARRPIETALQRLQRRGRDSLLVILATASAAILAYMLVPFDFTFTAADLDARLDAVADLLWQVPGADRPRAMQAAMLAAGGIGVIPIGMLLALLQPYRPVGFLAVEAVLAMTAATLAAVFVMSASPALLNIPWRSAWIVLGVLLMRWLQRHDIERGRNLVRVAAGLAILPYLAALVLVNGLAALQWRGFDAAMAAIDGRYFVPMWTHYIVTKAQATRSEISQLAMYAPVGLIVWALGCKGRGCSWIAAFLALLLSSAVEYARWMRPGQLLDINNPPIAAIGAALATVAAPFLWDVLRNVYAPPARSRRVARAR